MIKFFILLFILVLLLKFIIDKIIIIKKSNRFLRKYFFEDKLYSAEEVANIFKLDKDNFFSLIKTLEQYNYFSFFNKRGIIMTKDFYSKYELKYLIRIFSKKQKLKVSFYRKRFNVVKIELIL